MVKNTTITKWAEGFEFATLGLHETAEEDSFLTKVSEYIAENSTITRVDAWKCIVKQIHQILLNRKVHSRQRHQNQRKIPKIRILRRKLAMLQNWKNGSMR